MPKPYSLNYNKLDTIFFRYHAEPMWIYDSDSQYFLAVNDSAQVKYQYSKSEFAQMKVADIQKENQNGISLHKSKDGYEFWVEVSTQSITFDGKAAELVTTRDAGERKKNEDELKRTQSQYRSIFENAIEGIFQTTPEGYYISANPALAKIYGYDSPDELIAGIADIANLLYVDPNRRIQFILRMQQDGVVINFESQVRKRSGEIIWITESSRAVHDSDGSLMYYEGMVEDITERKALEEEREQLLNEAIARADLDPLTGLLNHRALHKKIEEALEHIEYAKSEGILVLIDLDNFQFFNDAYGHAAGDDVLRRVAAYLKNSSRPQDTLARFGGDEFALLMTDITMKAAIKIIEKCAESLAKTGYRPPGHDYCVPLHISYGWAAFPTESSLRQDIINSADRRLLKSKSGGTENELTAELYDRLTHSIDGFSMLDALVTAVDNKDRYTRRHSEDVLKYCMQIAERLGLDEGQKQDLQTAALLHDVGKIGVPDYILRKPGKLNEAEYAAIKHHPMMGAMIVGAIPGFEATLDAIRHHHEQWDGLGYPYGLRAEEIPFFARIMAVADAYSAITMNRPYRLGMTKERALQILRKGAGTQWDPICVDAFCKSFKNENKDELNKLAA